MFIKYLIFFESFVIAALVGFNIKFILCFGFNINDFTSTIISCVGALPIPAIGAYFTSSCTCINDWER